MMSSTISTAEFGGAEWSDAGRLRKKFGWLSFGAWPDTAEVIRGLAEAPGCRAETDVSLKQSAVDSEEAKASAIPASCQCHVSAVPVPCQCMSAPCQCHVSAMPVPCWCAKHGCDRQRIYCPSLLSAALLHSVSPASEHEALDAFANISASVIAHGENGMSLRILRFSSRNQRHAPPVHLRSSLLR